MNGYYCDECQVWSNRLHTPKYHKKLNDKIEIILKLDKKAYQHIKDEYKFDCMARDIHKLPKHKSIEVFAAHILNSWLDFNRREIEIKDMLQDLRNTIDNKCKELKI